jgi:hypothetical protein
MKVSLFIVGDNLINLGYWLDNHDITSLVPGAFGGYKTAAIGCFIKHNARQIQEASNFSRKIVIYKIGSNKQQAFTC